jgi:cytochrome c oxidase assembly protein subunit 15
MKRLLRLALATDFVALMTVVLGSWTRINDAGLTCPDWPLCRGHIIPLMTDGTLWEWTHRLLAFTVAPLTIALVAAAWPVRSRSPFVGPTTAAIVAFASFC